MIVNSYKNIFFIKFLTFTLCLASLMCKANDPVSLYLTGLKDENNSDYSVQCHSERTYDGSGHEATKQNFAPNIKNDEGNWLEQYIPANESHTIACHIINDKSKVVKEVWFIVTICDGWNIRVQNFTNVPWEGVFQDVRPQSNGNTYIPDANNPCQRIFNVDVFPIPKTGYAHLVLKKNKSNDKDYYICMQEGADF